MKSLIETKLNIPVYEPHETITFPSATIDAYKVSADNYGDGMPVTENESIKIDLWYRDKEACRQAAFDIHSELLKDHLNSNPEIDFSFDTTARCYRATLSFEKRR